MKFHSRRIMSLWNRAQFGNDKNRDKKHIDGQFVFDSLFSVSAFASRNEKDIQVKLAQRTAEKLLIKVRLLRNDIQAMNHQLRNRVGDITVNKTVVDNKPVTIKVEESKYTPETVMLTKVFIACDEYFLILHKAKINGEITDSEQQRYRRNAINKIKGFLSEANKTCISFHKVRKQAV